MTKRANRICTAVAAYFMASAGTAVAQTPDLTMLSLEALLNVEVTSVSRKEQTLARTPAAVHVITDEDIRRSGARTIPDLLRLVPGFSVAQIDATAWAITSRGFNGLYANKLLVLVDGRSVYSQLFGGVHWDMVNLLLADIDRIEVVRGPGGSLWGTNAVNGVVNIITKSADQTPGVFAKASLGGTERAGAEVRYGGRAGGSGYYRLYGRHAERGTGATLRGIERADDASMQVAGARLDWRGETHRVSVHGNLQQGESDHAASRTLLQPPWRSFVKQQTTFTDGHALLSWTASNSSRLEHSLQGAYQRYVRQSRSGNVHGSLVERADLVEVDARRRQLVNARHEVIGGAGYRLWSADIQNASHIGFLPAREQTHVVTAFVRDEITIWDALQVTPGSKFEWNAFTGLEMQPSLRGIWTPRPGQSLWAAVSRSVRTPSKSDRGLQVVSRASPGTAGVPRLVLVRGNPELDAERMRALELGFRAQLGRVSFDVAAFQNGYDGLVNAVAAAPTAGVHDGQRVTIVPLIFENALHGHTRGLESVVSLELARWWRVTASAAFLDVATHAHEGAERNRVSAADAPARQFAARSYLNLPRGIGVNAFASWVDGVQGLSVAYTALNTRVAWHPRPPVEFAVGADNLLHDGDVEFLNRAGVQPAPVRRAAYVDVTWKFGVR